MSVSIFTAFALAAALSVAQEPAAPETAAPETPEAAARDLAAVELFTDGLAAAFLSEHPIPGLIVSVVSGDETLAKGYGHSDLEAGRAAGGDDVRFEIGSTSKTFIWTAVMMLEAEGVLDLHADVNTYLTSFQAGRGGEPITLAQLMSHRPGLEDSFAIFLPEFAALPRHEALARTEPRQVMGRGAATAYSNWGTVLAAQVIEDVSGLSYRDFLYARILEPLGMTATTFLEGDARPDQPPLSVSYHIRGGAPVAAARLDIGAFGPAGSMASTAADMARWMRFHLNGGELGGVRLMPAESHARMLTRLYDDRPGGADMAHGFMHWQVAGVDVYGHGGAINEFLTMMAFAPELGAGVFASQNASPAMTPAFRLPDLVLARLIDEAGLAREPGAAPDNAADSARDAAGRYLANRRVHAGVERLFAAGGLLSLTAEEDGALTAASAMGAERLAPVGPDLWQDRHGRRYAAIRGPDGSVTGIADALGVHTYERVGVSTDPNLLVMAAGGALLMSLTVWLGLWRRLGARPAPGRGETVRGRAVSVFDLAAAVLVIACLVTLGAALAGMSDFSMELMKDYPPPLLRAAMALSGAVVIAAVLAAAAMVPAIAMSGWSIWRKAHHGLFALALAAFAWALVNWGLAFGGHAGG
ncbi:MAG: beta-lactamase family protein [Oceanicaulis sp.]|nr:beta-lactamase family protein [Oceanicaulis sp.]